MRGDNEELQGGRELNYVSQKDPYNGSLLSKMIDAINAVAKHAGVSAVGKVPPPPPIDRINVQGTLSGDTVTCPSEILHWTMNHNQAISKGLHYISEIDTDPNFPAPHVVDHGCSRTGFLHLPTLQNGGMIPNIYYLRSYAQYPGGDPCKPTVHGNLGGAIKIKMTGGTNPSSTSLLSSTGSGTATPNGQQGGHGLGIILNRPAPGPKRNVS